MSDMSVIQTSEVSTEQQKLNDRVQRLKDTPTLHQKLIPFTQIDPSTIMVQDENIEIEDVEDKSKEQTEKNTDPPNEEVMSDTSNVWDSSIKQSWKDTTNTN